MMAYALTGFAVLHTLTLALKSRALWLGCTYAIMVVFGWPVLAMVVLGLADAIFGFRQRYLRGRPPPLPASCTLSNSTTQSDPLRRTNIEVILLERFATLGQ